MVFLCGQSGLMVVGFYCLVFVCGFLLVLGFLWFHVIFFVTNAISYICVV